jgi:hypothetical protein
LSPVLPNVDSIYPSAFCSSHSRSVVNVKQLLSHIAWSTQGIEDYTSVPLHLKLGVFSFCWLIITFQKPRLLSVRIGGSSLFSRALYGTVHTPILRAVDDHLGIPPHPHSAHQIGRQIHSQNAVEKSGNSWICASFGRCAVSFKFPADNFCHNTNKLSIDI